MADEFVVQSATPERLYVKTYHDFLDSEILDGKQKLVFILLKRYLDFSKDQGGMAGKVYPTLETLSKQAGMTKKTVADIIKKLEEKGIIEVKQQGLNRPNIYSMRDFSGIWKAKTDDEVRAAIDTYEEEYEDSLLIAKLRSRGYEVIKAKELGSAAPTKVTEEPSTHFKYFFKNNFKQKAAGSQEAMRYTLEDIQEIYDYNVMIQDHPELKNNIDSVMDILDRVLNSSQSTIRIGKEDKPTMVVIGKLMKLEYPQILFAIDKYREQRDKIKNPQQYMLTLLYNAKAQMDLEVTNQVQHDFYS